MSLSEAPAASIPGPDDSSLAASFNQRLKELSGDELAYDGPLTGAASFNGTACCCVCEHVVSPHLHTPASCMASEEYV